MMSTNQEHETMNHAITIWLDAQVYTSKDCLQTQKYLRRIFTDLILFNDENICRSYIDSAENAKIFLIVSGQLGKKIVPIIHSLKQIEAIYIFCHVKHTYEQWSKDYDKIRGVFDDSSFLLSKLCFNINSRFNNPPPISVFNTTDSTEKSIRSLNKQSTTFMWFQLLLEILLRMPTTDQSQNEMISFCRFIYENNNEELIKIEEFENFYRPDLAILLYTRDSFLYRLMNQLLRTENIDMIYTFRSFIKDLHQSLEKLHPQYIQLLQCNTNTLTVYRGQRVSTVELEELKKNIHSLIAMNTFLSTTLQKHVAIAYAGAGEERPYVESVLFEINIDITDEIGTKPFAMIADHSYYNTEDEVLFSMNAIFQIDSVEQLSTSMWIVKMHLTSVEDEQLKTLNEYLKNNIRKETTLLDLGNFLLTMGEDDKAIEYFKLFLKENPSNERDVSYVYTQIGHIYMKKDMYDMALYNYETALDFQASSQPPNYLWLPHAYENIAYAHEKLGQNRIAYKYYEHQMNLYLTSVKQNDDLIMKVKQKLNSLSNNSDQFQKEELEYSKQRLEIYLKFRPSNHPDLIKIFSDVAFAYGHLNNYTDSCDNYRQALEICVLSLPPNHEQTRISHYNLAHCQCKTENYEKSLYNYDMSLQYELQCQSPKPLFIAKIYNGRGHVYFQRKDFQLAMENYSQAIKISDQNLTSVCEYYINLYYALSNIGEYQNALDVLNKALKTEQNSSSCRSFLIVELYLNIGHTYFALKDYTNAIDYYKTVLETYEHTCDVSFVETMQDNESTANQYKKFFDNYFYSSTESGHRNDLIPVINQSYDDLITEYSYDWIDIYVRSETFENALEICQKVIDIELSYPLRNVKTIGSTYSKMAFMYFEMKNYDKSIMHLEKIFELNRDAPSIGESTVALIYKNLASNICTNTANDEEAIKLCNKLLNLELSRNPSTEFGIAYKYNNIGYIYYSMKQYEKAIESFEYGINISTPSTNEEKEDFLLFTENLEKVYSEIRNFTSAILCCKKRFILKLEWNHNVLLSIADTYSKLASLYFKNDNYLISIKYWQKSVDIYLTLSWIDENLIFETYRSLINAFRKNKNYSQATICCQQALNIQLKNSSLAIIYNEIGICYYEQHNYLLSIAHYTKAIDIMSDDPKIDTVFFDNLGGAYQMAKMYDKALDHYNQSLQIKLERKSTNAFKIAESYANLGNIYFLKEKYQISIDNYQEAIKISLSIIPSPNSLISWYGDLAEVYYVIRNLEQAESTCQLALEKEKSISNLDGSGRAAIYRHMSNILVIKGHHNEALEFDRIMLDIYSTNFPLDYDTVGIGFNNYGRTLFHMELYDESLTHFQKALDILHKSTAIDNETNSIVYKNIGELYGKIHQFENAVENYEKSIEYLIAQIPMNDDYHLLYIKVYHKRMNFYILKHLTTMRNLVETQLL